MLRALMVTAVLMGGPVTGAYVLGPLPPAGGLPAGQQQATITATLAITATLTLAPTLPPSHTPDLEGTAIAGTVAAILGTRTATAATPTPDRIGTGVAGTLEALTTRTPTPSSTAIPTRTPSATAVPRYRLLVPIALRRR